ncbi:MAG: glycosyltransferase [Brachybacterium sp.]|nr:glycosyltransferase [Brachybacterium sp.]
MPSDTPRIAYVLKMYPRFSETFIVSEILAREAAGEDIVIYSLRPPVDARFHPELARVRAPVVQVGRASSPRRLWESWGQAAADPRLAEGSSRHLDELLAASVDDAEQALTVARLAREDGVTHLHAHFASMATTVARLASLVAGIPYSFTAHAKDIFHDDVQEEDLRSKLRDAHHAITISDYNLRHLRSRFGTKDTSRLHLVRNGLEIDRFPYTPRPAGPTTGPIRLLGVGRLVEKKGFVHLVDAVAALRAEGRDVQADVVGDGPLHEQLTERIRQHGLDAHVRLLGPRTQEEVRGLLAAADLFVAPFVIAEDGNADGLPTVLLEAMASGIPCIAADVTAVGEVVRDGETGRLVPAGDTAALTAAIAEACDQHQAVAACTDAARALVTAYFDGRRQAGALRDLVTHTAGGSR